MHNIQIRKQVKFFVLSFWSFGLGSFLKNAVSMALTQGY